jgi:alkaline phosphatase D
VNLVLVSDHGMAASPAADAVLVDLAEHPGARFVGGGGVGWIFAGEGATRRDLEALHASVRAQVPEDVGVYLREELPDSLHLAGTDRAGDVVLVPPTGVAVLPAGATPRDTWSHGWAPGDRDMWGIFVASGPAIPEGARLRAFESIHIYPFVAALLDLEPAEVDGSIDVLGDLIRR